jgi:hypothetical protein
MERGAKVPLIRDFKVSFDTRAGKLYNCLDRFKAFQIEE